MNRFTSFFTLALVSLYFMVPFSHAAPAEDALALKPLRAEMEKFYLFLDSGKAPDLREVERHLKTISDESAKIIEDAKQNDATKEQGIRVLIQAYRYACAEDQGLFFAGLESKVAYVVGKYPATAIAAWAECEVLKEIADPRPEKFVDQLKEYQKKYPTAQDAIVFAVSDYAGALRSDQGTAASKDFLDDCLAIYPSHALLKAAREALEAIGKPVSLSGPTLDGKTFDITHWNGKVVLIVFWASWCGPCKATTPHLQKMYADLNASGLEIVGISLDATKKEAAQYVSDKKIPWTQVFLNKASERMKLAEKWNSTGIPAFSVVEKKGNLTDLVDFHHFEAAQALVESELKK